MQIYNTLTRQKTELIPLDGKTVRIYSCGPTVYDHAHIGNLAAYIFADTLRRVVASKFSVKHVMNYTDVDDKTIKHSSEQYADKEPKAALKQLTDYYIELFLQDMKKIGNDVDSLHFVRATDTIEEMKKLITDLHNQRFAYTAEDGVYFSIEAYKKSGKKYGQLLEITSENTSTARIQNDEYDKESAHDFTLWKKQKIGEPAWQFELDGQDVSGRPGWHIECSAMSKLELGQPFDIHTGGIDLIFPHHENEIAQSTALADNPVMATIFAHNNHVLVDGKKMAKSAKNFYTLTDIEEKGYDPLAFRLMILQSHYRSEAHFSWDNLEAAQNRLNNWRAVAVLRYQLVDKAQGPTNANDVNIESRLLDDLNTPEALSNAQIALESYEKSGVSEANLDAFKQLLATIDALFGLDLSKQADISEEQKVILSKRTEARGNQDWEQSDKLRDKLKEQGILVRDTEHGQVWSRA